MSRNRGSRAARAEKKEQRRSRAKSDEQLRIVCLEWMEQTVEFDRKKIEKIRAERIEEEARLDRIRLARLEKSRDYKKVEHRRAAANQPRPRQIVIGLICPTGLPVHCTGNIHGTGVSLTMRKDRKGLERAVVEPPANLIRDSIARVRNNYQQRMRKTAEVKREKQTGKSLPVS